MPAVSSLMEWEDRGVIDRRTEGKVIYNRISQAGWLVTEIEFSEFWRLEVQNQGAGLGGSGERPLQGCRLPTSGILTWRSEGNRILWGPFYKVANPFMKAPPL